MNPKMRMNQLSEISVKKHSLSFKWKVKLLNEIQPSYSNYLLSTKLFFDEIDVSVQIKFYIHGSVQRFELLWGGNISQSNARYEWSLKPRKVENSCWPDLHNIMIESPTIRVLNITDFRSQTEPGSYEFFFDIFYNIIVQTDYIDLGTITPNEDADQVASKITSIHLMEALALALAEEKEKASIKSTSGDTPGNIQHDNGDFKVVKNCDDQDSSIKKNDEVSKKVSGTIRADTSDKSTKTFGEEDKVALSQSLLLQGLCPSAFKSGDILDDIHESSNVLESNDDSDGFEVIGSDDDEIFVNEREFVSEEVSETIRAGTSDESKRPFDEENEDAPNAFESVDTPLGNINESSNVLESNDDSDDFEVIGSDDDDSSAKKKEVSKKVSETIRADTSDESTKPLDEENEEAPNAFESGETTLGDINEYSNILESNDESDDFDVIGSDDDEIFMSEDNDDLDYFLAKNSEEFSETIRAEIANEKIEPTTEDVSNPAKSNDNPDGIEESSSTSNSEDKTPVKFNKEQSDRLTRIYRSFAPETTAVKLFDQWTELLHLPDSLKDSLGQDFAKQVSLKNFGEIFYFADALRFNLLKNWIIKKLVLREDITKLLESSQWNTFVQVLNGESSDNNI